MLNKEVLESIFEKLLSQAKKSYDEFNAADGKIGDGDLGVTILNGLEEVNNNKANFKDDMGANFMFCSQAFVKKSGSSFGTLIAFSFMNISKTLKGKTECNHEDIINIFKTALNINDDKMSENLKYNEIEEWDSIGHMTLIAALEEEYKISLETDDIIEFSSFKKGLSILKKYNIEIS